MATCFKCKKPFKLPTGEELDHNCPRCGASPLDGITCPECLSRETEYDDVFNQHTCYDCESSWGCDI